jgi:hypothetical protein
MMTGTGIGHGAHTTSGPHDSNLESKLDPRVGMDARNSDQALKGAPSHMTRFLPLVLARVEVSEAVSQG